MKEPDKDPAERGRTPFARFIQEQRQGALHSELSDAIADLSQAVLAVEKPGKLVLTLKVVPSKDGQTIIISDDLKLTIPEPARGAGIFFVDADGNISRENPYQQRLPLQAVDKRTGELRELDERGNAINE
jgi:hypothetical protein